MRSEETVREWINSSRSSNFKIEKKACEPEITNDHSECGGHNDAKQWEIRTLILHGIAFQKILGHYILSNEALQLLDPCYTPNENFLAAFSTHALYKAQPRTHMN